MVSQRQIYSCLVWTGRLTGHSVSWLLKMVSKVVVATFSFSVNMWDQWNENVAMCLVVPSEHCAHDAVQKESDQGCQKVK
jgi:exopolysaccharide biosynthesis predicted pyruvyltransferase EpsI